MIQLSALPEPRPATLWPSQWFEAIGSSGAGKALNLARLGCHVTLHAFTGDDGDGRRVRQGLTAVGITLLPAHDPAGTARHVNLMDPAGRRVSIVLSAGSGPDLDLPFLERAIADVDLVFLEIVDHARRLLPLAAQHGTPIWTDLHDYDGSDAYHEDFIAAAEVVLLSDTRIPEPRATMERIAARGARLVVTTLGDRGAIALSAGRWLQVPAEPVTEIIDTNGAGDAFAAGLLVGEWLHLPLEASLRLGARVAAASIGSRELAAPSLDLATLLRGLEQPARPHRD